MDRDGTGDFNLIASEVKLAYQKLDNGLLSQDEIVNGLAEWIKINQVLEVKICVPVILWLRFYTELRGVP